MLTQYQQRGFSVTMGFAVLVMPAIHTVLLYSEQPVKQGPLGILLEFLSASSGASLFMLLLGMFIALEREKTVACILKRSVLLLAAEYLLNGIKFLVPYYLDWMPQQFLTDHGIAINTAPPVQLLLSGGLLQFAAIAYAGCALLKKCTKNSSVYVLVFLLVLLVIPYTWQLNSKGIWPVSLAVFTTKSPGVFSPCFLWLLYPLAGLITANLLVGGGDAFNRSLAGISLGFILAGYLLILTEPAGWQTGFYRPGRGGALFHIGLALGWVWLFVVLAQRVPDNYLFHLLKWLGNHLLLFYMVQWVVISWCLPLIEYQHLQVLPSVLLLCATTGVSCLILFFALTGSEKNVWFMRLTNETWFCRQMR